jgi:hypothetical protein
MNTSNSITEITKAIIAVMKEIKGIDKSMTVGAGNSSYKGVSDKDVKIEIGRAMEKNGLCIVPTEVTPKLQIDRWEEIDQYSKVQGATKQKQAVFAEVTTKYLLLHESGEWIELSGYGHGADTQDKAAGKATTYALKYTLLYTFMVPTGKIDDADNTHSDDIPVRQPAPKAKPELKENTDAFNGAVEFVKGGGSIEKIEGKYKMTEAVKETLSKHIPVTA